MGREPFADTGDLVADILHLLTGLLELHSGNRPDRLVLIFETFECLLGILNLTSQGFLLFDGLFGLRSILQLL